MIIGKLLPVSIAALGLIFASPLLAAQSDIVVIGDSQSQGNFGRQLLKDLKSTHKKRASYYARPGSTADWWLEGLKADQNWSSWDAPYGEPERRVHESLPTPLLEDLIAKHDPKIVVIQLGGNMHFQSDSRVIRSTRDLISKVKQEAIQCLWLGPPPGDKRPEPRFREFYKILKETVEAEGCLFLDARTVIIPAPKGGDGIHLDTMPQGARAVRQWIDRSVKIILENL